MAPQAWGDDLLVCVPQIDREHRGIIDIANDFRTAVDAGVPRAELGALLARLAGAVESHFASEERLMLSSGYRGYQAHHDEHARLLGQFSTAQGEFASGVIHPGGALALFVEVWTGQHILSWDQDFARFLKTDA
jgi:hemerythrin